MLTVKTWTFAPEWRQCFMVPVRREVIPLIMIVISLFLNAISHSAQIYPLNCHTSVITPDNSYFFITSRLCAKQRLPRLNGSSNFDDVTPSDFIQYSFVEDLRKYFVQEANAPLLKQLRGSLNKINVLKSEYDIDPYPEIFVDETPTKYKYILDKYASLESGSETNHPEYRIHGRIHSMRFDGLFVVLVDDYFNKLQVLFKRTKAIKINGKTIYGSEVHSILNLGDIITVFGPIKKTKTGEITLVASELGITAKCLLPLPDTWHGLKDIETRYRLRHLDILTNEDTKNTLLLRSNAIRTLREFLHTKGFIEVETPILQCAPSGANASPFSTFHNSLNSKFYMRIAPEISLKRLMVAGLAEKIFEIGKCFRNEGIDRLHSPEFTMVEIYEKMASMMDMMSLTEEIIENLLRRLNVTIQGKTVLNWTIKSMSQLIMEYTGIDVLQEDSNSLICILEKYGIQIPYENNTVCWGTLVAELFKHKVERQLKDPTHVTMLPLDISPLADASEVDARQSKRFESYIAGMEIANGCTEECNPIEIIKRLKNHNIQEVEDTEGRDFTNSLAYGMPPTAGLGIGIDRLIMILSNCQNIKDVQAFPLLKS